MIILKSIVFVLIFCTTTLIGIIISNKYKSRVKELKEIKTALNVLETKMKYTYEPIAEIFNEISAGTNSNISNIFKNTVSNMYHHSAGDAWTNALDNTNTNLNKEDISVLKNRTLFISFSDSKKDDNDSIVNSINNKLNQIQKK